MAEVKQGPPKKPLIRPEWLILVLLIVSVPLVGFYTYRRVSFEFNNLVSALQTHPCTFSKAGGEWDMSKLRKSAEICKGGSDPSACRDYTVHRQDEDFHFNVCGNAITKPSECSALLGEGNVRRAVGYQTADGVCYYMGLLKTGEWSLLNPNRATDGVRLTYTGGSQCDGATQRSTQFYFECNPKAGRGHPVAVVLRGRRRLRASHVLTLTCLRRLAGGIRSLCLGTAGRGHPVAVFGDCEFIVTWETALACPNRQSPYWAYLFWVLLAAVAYFALGFAYNVRYKHMGMDSDSIPHVELLRSMGAHLAMLIAQVVMVTGAVASRVWEFLVERAPALGGVESTVGGALGALRRNLSALLSKVGLHSVADFLSGEGICGDGEAGGDSSRSGYETF